jgi:hypothetical protein
MKRITAIVLLLAAGASAQTFRIRVLDVDGTTATEPIANTNVVALIVEHIVPEGQTNRAAAVAEYLKRKLVEDVRAMRREARQRAAREQYLRAVEEAQAE